MAVDLTYPCSNSSLIGPHGHQSSNFLLADLSTGTLVDTKVRWIQKILCMFRVVTVFGKTINIPHTPLQTFASVNLSALSFSHMPTLNNSVCTKHPATLWQMLICLMTYFSEVFFLTAASACPPTLSKHYKWLKHFSIRPFIFPSIHSIPRLDIVATLNRIKASFFKPASVSLICGIIGFAALRGWMFPHNLSINRLWH